MTPFTNFERTKTCMDPSFLQIRPAELWKFLSCKQYYKLKVKNDHRSKFSNLSNWKEEASHQYYNL